MSGSEKNLHDGDTEARRGNEELGVASRRWVWRSRPQVLKHDACFTAMLAPPRSENALRGSG